MLTSPNISVPAEDRYTVCYEFLMSWQEWKANLLFCFFFFYWQWGFKGEEGANTAHKLWSAKLRETFWIPLKCEKIEFKFDVVS